MLITVVRIRFMATYCFNLLIGDLNLLIEDHFDTTTGPLNAVATFNKVISKIKEQPGEVLFLTKSADEVLVVCVTKMFLFLLTVPQIVL